jgi:hypothetical protein
MMTMRASFEMQNNNNPYFPAWDPLQHTAQECNINGQTDRSRARVVTVG